MASHLLSAVFAIVETIFSWWDLFFVAEVNILPDDGRTWFWDYLLYKLEYAVHFLRVYTEKCEVFVACTLRTVQWCCSVCASYLFWYSFTVHYWWREYCSLFSSLSDWRICFPFSCTSYDTTITSTSFYRLEIGLGGDSSQNSSWVLRVVRSVQYCCSAVLRRTLLLRCRLLRVYGTVQCSSTTY